MMRKVLLLGVLLGILTLGTASLGWGEAFLLDGTNWSQISYDAKVGYVKGVGNMADFEAGASKQGRMFCLATTLVKELQDKSIDTVVKEIDQFYKENPGKMTTSVLEVMLRRADKVCPPEKK